VVAYLPVPKWKELHIIAVADEMTIGALVHHGVDLVIDEYKNKRNAI
jgi:predicted DNA-binding ribbon-helix-helix protein